MEKNIVAPKVFALWLAASASIGTLASYGYSVLRDYELRFARIEAQYQRSEQRAESHEVASAEWKARIIDNEHDIQKLAADVFARPNSFVTGAEGKTLERRIDELERNSEKMIYMEKRVHELQNDFRESESYYRRQILPLFEQSNALQQHRIQQSMNHD